MKKIIFILLCVMNIHNALADAALKDIPLREWDVIEKNIYTNPSFIYYSQNPFPTCYSLIANILIDLFECDKNNQYCKKRSSYLDTALLGEVKTEKQTRSLSNGGNTLLILNEIRKKKSVTSFQSCNYNHITHNFSNMAAIENSLDNIQRIRESYFKYEKYSPYLTQYYKKQYLKSMLVDFSIKVEDSEKLLLLESINKDQLYEYIIKYYCQVKENYTIEPYKINTYINKGLENTQIKMEELMSNKIPFAVTFCLDQKTQTLKQETDCVARHIIIVNGQSKIKNFRNGEEKEMLNVINTWGEDWQNKTSSLIEYNNFKEYMFQNIIWLSS